MKILNLLVNPGLYPSAEVSESPIDNNIFQALTIEVDTKVIDRGVIAYEKLQGFKAIGYQSSLVAKNKKSNAIVEVIKSISALAMLLFSDKVEMNKVSLVPENSDYPGFILAFKSKHWSIKAILVTLESDQDEVVITNQTAYVTAIDKYNNVTSGNLTVIHCQEHIPLEFTYYASDLLTRKCDLESTCSKGKMYIEPIPEWNNNQYTVRFELEKSITVDPDFLVYLIESLGKDIKDVYYILEDETLTAAALESYRLSYKQSQYDKTLSYNSSKVI
jgi:hypothetical protein